MNPNNVTQMIPKTGQGRELTIAVGTGSSSNRVKNRKMTWNEFVERLSNVVRTQETVKEYHNMSKEDKSAAKDVGYFIGGYVKGGIRNKRNLQYRDVLTLDIDKAAVGCEDRIKQVLDGYAYVLHSTHSHTKELPKFRLIIPLTCEIHADEHAYISRHIGHQIEMEWFDAAGFRYSQLMYWASTPKDGDYIYYEGKGKWVNPKQIFSDRPDWRDTSTCVFSCHEIVRVEGAVSTAENPRAKRGIVGAFCRAYSIEEAMAKWIPDVYEISSGSGGNGTRYTFISGSTQNGAIIYGDGDWLYSHHGSDPCGGLLVNSFDMIRLHLFGHKDDKTSGAVTGSKRPSYIEMSNLVAMDPAAKRQIVLMQRDDARKDFSDGFGDDGCGHDENLGILDGSCGKEVRDAADAVDVGVREKDDPNKGVGWESFLDISAKGKIQNTTMNISLILENDKHFNSMVALNEFNGDMVQRQDLPGVPVGNGLWKNVSDTAVRIKLEREYGVEFSADRVAAGIERLAYMNRHHPVKDWLESLEWDGIERMETLFIDYLGADDNEYHREVCKTFFAGAVTRIMEPGCKFDFVPIIEGKQGIRKSTFWRVLSNGWFTELATFQHKDAAEIIRGMWIVEVSELDAFNKHEIETIKSFFSKNEDRLREAYARRAETTPRQCVFVGSTNREQYLKDDTGNRRYWPIRCRADEIDTDKLKREIKQIWAEAMVSYMMGADLYLKSNVAKQAEEVQETRRQADDWHGIIEEWLSEEAYADRYSSDFPEGEKVERDRVCAAEIFTDCLGFNRNSITRRDSNRITSILRNMDGWEMQEKTMRFGKRFGAQRGAVKKISNVTKIVT